MSAITSRGFNASKIPDLSQKVVIVTGANVGLGYETTLAIAAKGAHVFLACRSKERAEAAIVSITEKLKVSAPGVTPRLEFLELDLNDIKKADASAKEFVKKGLPLHILINNSGIMNTPFGLTADGIEQQFGVNHVGHFVFTMGLLDVLKQSQPSRVVNLSSDLHARSNIKGGIDFATLNEEKPLSNLQRYSRSKLANVLFTKALARRLENEKVYVNAIHPGVVWTELTRHTSASMGIIAGKLIKVVGPLFMKRADEGALNQLYIATAPEVETADWRGKYFVPVGKETAPNKAALDEKLQEELWAYSEKVMNEKLGREE